MAITLNGDGSVTGIVVEATDIENGSITPAKLSGITGDGTATQVITSVGDGTFSWADAGGGARILKRTDFNTSGSWTKDADATYVEIWASGGSGGGAIGRPNYGDCAGIGAAGGACAHIVCDASALPNTAVTVTLGAGGSEASSMNVCDANLVTTAGGTTTFGSYITCNGGSGGHIRTPYTSYSNRASFPSQTGGTASTNLSTGVNMSHLADGGLGGQDNNFSATYNNTYINQGLGTSGGAGTYGAYGGGANNTSSGVVSASGGLTFFSNQNINATGAQSAWAPQNGTDGKVYVIEYGDL